MIYKDRTRQWWTTGRLANLARRDSPPPGSSTLTDANLREWQRQGAAFAQQVADRVAALPGVEAVGYVDQLPLSPTPGGLMA